MNVRILSFTRIALGRARFIKIKLWRMTVIKMTFTKCQDQQTTTSPGCHHDKAYSAECHSVDCSGTL